MAEQLISTNAPSRLGLNSWIARAASSLPVPVAPVTNTEASVGATRSMTEKSFLITGDWPMRVGVLELRIWKFSCWSRAIADLARLLELDQPSITVGVARGINSKLLNGVESLVKFAACNEYQWIRPWGVLLPNW